MLRQIIRPGIPRSVRKTLHHLGVGATTASKVGELPTTGWIELEREGFHWRLCMDHYLDREIATKGSFEPKTAAMTRKILRPGMRVLDVGANFGYWTLHFAKLVGPRGHVWAFEPTREYGRRLHEHVERNGFSKRITISDHGLSDQAADLEISIGNSSATLHQCYEHSRASETIQLKRLDDEFPVLGIPSVDFIKLDIDGHEPAMLRGAENVVRRHRPILVVEVSQEHLDVAGTDVRQVKEQIEDLGYTLVSEKTQRPYASRAEFLKECGNFTHSANVWAFPRGNGKGGFFQ